MAQALGVSLWEMAAPAVGATHSSNVTFIWDRTEVSKLWNASYRNRRDRDEVRELCDQWGGCVRWILEKPYEDSKNKLQDLEALEAVDSST